MLDEEEFATISELYRDGIHATKEFRQRHNLSFKDASVHDRFRPVRDAYERMTGFKEANENAILHHRLSLYGPPCSNCGKPLRTAKARKCFVCGTARAV